MLIISTASVTTLLYNLLLLHVFGDLILWEAVELLDQAKAGFFHSLFRSNICLLPVCNHIILCLDADEDT